jgi:hypothetical protein
MEGATDPSAPASLRHCLGRIPIFYLMLHTSPVIVYFIFIINSMFSFFTLTLLLDIENIFPLTMTKFADKKVSNKPPAKEKNQFLESKKTSSTDQWQHATIA